MRVSKIGRSTLIVVGVVFVAASCADNATPASGGPKVPEFYAAAYTLDDAEVLFMAETKILSDCMRQRGFELASPTFVPTVELVRDGDRRWGVTDVADAAAFGYHSDVGLDELMSLSDEARAKDQAYFDSMTASERDEYFLALEGSPYNVSAPQVSSVQATIPGSKRVLAVVLAGQSDSCRRQIAPALGQDFAVFEALNAAVTRASSDVDALAQTNPRFEQAIDEWRQCFRQAGFEANDPLAALDTFHAPGPRPSTGERRAAQADAQCKESADLLGMWNQAVRSAEIVIGEDIRPELEYWLEMRVSILSNAVSILESG